MRLRFGTLLSRSKYLELCRADAEGEEIPSMQVSLWIDHWKLEVQGAALCGHAIPAGVARSFARSFPPDDVKQAVRILSKAENGNALISKLVAK